MVRRAAHHFDSLVNSCEVGNFGWYFKDEEVAETGKRFISTKTMEAGR